MKEENLNNVSLVGFITKIEDSFKTTRGKIYHKFILAVERASKAIDYIPVIYADDNEKDTFHENDTVMVNGKISTVNKVTNGRSKLEVNIVANTIVLPDSVEVDNINEVNIEGYICKTTVGRYTPKGRYAFDFILACNSRSHSSYIPCIAFGDTARFTELLKLGDKVKITGRMQSRDYQKRWTEDNGDDIFLSKTAYELAIKTIDVVE